MVKRRSHRKFLFLVALGLAAVTPSSFTQGADNRSCHLAFSDHSSLTLQNELNKIRFTPLVESLALSGLSSRQLGVLQQKARAVVDVEGFMAQPPLNPGYILGLTRVGSLSVYTVFAEAKDLKRWPTAYFDFAIDTSPRNTNEFMTAITSTNDPIVFLVPNRVFDRNFRGVTAHELRWLLNRPESLGSITFVFGAYDWVHPELLALGKMVPESELNAALVRYLNTLSSRAPMTPN